MSTQITRRSLLSAGLLALTGCGQPPPAPVEAAHAATPTGTSRLRLVGESTLPHRMDFAGTTVGGLSGIDYQSSTGLYALISDDRSVRNPARFYTAHLPLDGHGLGTAALQGVHLLRRADGSTFPSRRRARDGDEVPDPEAIRWLPNGHLLWCSEGAARHGMGPALHESRADGSLVRTLALPAMFDARPGEGTGPRDNQAAEGLALSPDGRTAWLAMETALLQDGPAPRVGAAGGPCRITALDVATGQALHQFAYVPDAISARGPVPGLVPPVVYADSGISEILMQDAHHMLVLERAYVAGQGMALRLYRVDTRSASNTLALPQLRADNHQPAAKTLVADFATLGLALLDNTEGMTWGPVLPSGHRSLVVVSDDNFRRSQTTQFAAFEFTE